jgi:hypothetical protein
MGSDAGDGDAFAGLEDEDEMERGGRDDRGESVEHDGGSFGSAGLAAGLIDAAIRDMGSRAETAESAELGGGDDALEGLADGVEVERVAHTRKIPKARGEVQGGCPRLKCQVPDDPRDRALNRTWMAIRNRSQRTLQMLSPTVAATIRPSTPRWNRSTT